MKKINIIIAIALSLCMTSCYEYMSGIGNPSIDVREKDKSFEEEFLAIWEGVNQSYLFWNITEQDWDAQREKLINYGKELDIQAKVKDIDLNAEKDKIEELFSGLKDNHMIITVVNPYISNFEERQKKALEISIGDIALNARKNKHQNMSVWNDYFESFKSQEHTINITHLLSGVFKDPDTEIETFAYCGVIDDNIPYLHMSRYGITEILNKADRFDDARMAVDFFFFEIQNLYHQGKLKGIILDNRANTGGNVDDLDYVVGYYIPEKKTCAKMRTKNGLGKYDFTPWFTTDVIPQYTNPYYIGDLGKIPYVVLQDQNSLSMAETTTNAISTLPTGCTIGETSYGGHGQISTTASYADNGYCGSYNVGKDKYGHGIYCSNFQCQLYDKKNQKWDFLENKGLEPDIFIALDVQQLTTTGHDNQLEKALEYIKSH